MKSLIYSALVMCLSLTAFANENASAIPAAAGENSPATNIDQILLATQEVVNILQEEKSPRPTRSQFFYLPAPGDLSAKLYFSNASRGGSYSTIRPNDNYSEYNSNLFSYYGDQVHLVGGSSQTSGFELTSNMGNQNYFTVDAAYVRTVWDNTVDNSGTEYGASEAKGLRDFRFTYTKAWTGASNAWVFGTDFVWSPKPAAQPTPGQAGSSFSGLSTIAPFFGYESTGRKGTWGTKVATVLFRQPLYINGNGQSDSYDRSSNQFSAFVDGFYEFPLAKFVNAGVALTLGNEGSNAYETDQLLTNYNSRIYSNFSFIKDTEFQLALGSQTFDNGTAQTSTDFSLSLRRTL
ncbi:MAG: hypothetical protein ABL958_10880 [Bdellovibrionia bacterium]